jgi:diacylglycerol kinase (ATP)
MKVKIILNPYANRWRAGKMAPQVEAAFQNAKLDYDLVVTTMPGQGTEEAAAAAAAGGYDAVIAAGGDSTVGEVLNGLIAAAGAAPTIPMGVLPLGTGNDFNDMAKLPRTLADCVARIASGQTRQLDAAWVGEPGGQGLSHYFDNNCALAMEPMVTIENVKMKRLSGNIRYIVALIKAIIRLKAWHMQINWHNGGETHSYEGPAYLLSICNSPRTGGLFYMAPQAKMDDGLLDFVFAPEIPRWQILAILPRLFNGSHINHPSVTTGHLTEMTVLCQPGTPIHADGEVLTESATAVQFRVLPGKITLLGGRADSPEVAVTS